MRNGTIAMTAATLLLTGSAALAQSNTGTPNPADPAPANPRATSGAQTEAPAASGRSAGSDMKAGGGMTRSGGNMGASGGNPGHANGGNGPGGRY